MSDLDDFMNESQPNNQLREELEDFVHFHRTCQFCGRNWYGLHCPHDGIQNPCPSCNKKPSTVPGDIEHCDCDFTITVDDAKTLIQRKQVEARVEQTRTILNLTKQSWSKNAPIANIRNIIESTLVSTNQVCLTQLARLEAELNKELEK